MRIVVASRTVAVRDDPFLDADANAGHQPPKRDSPHAAGSRASLFATAANDVDRGTDGCGRFLRLVRTASRRRSFSMVAISIRRSDRLRGVSALSVVLDTVAEREFLRRTRRPNPGSNSTASSGEFPVLEEPWEGGGGHFGGGGVSGSWDGPEVARLTSEATSVSSTASSSASDVIGGFDLEELAVCSSRHPRVGRGCLGRVLDRLGRARAPRRASSRRHARDRPLPAASRCRRRPLASNRHPANGLAVPRRGDTVRRRRRSHAALCAWRNVDRRSHPAPERRSRLTFAISSPSVESVTSNDLRGRGTGVNPPNRFERLHVDLDADPDAAAQDEAPSSSVPTLFYRDASRSVLAENTSPDIGFRFSLNPYRGCEHGCVYCVSGGHSSSPCRHDVAPDRGSTAGRCARRVRRVSRASEEPVSFVRQSCSRFGGRNARR